LGLHDRELLGRDGLFVDKWDSESDIRLLETACESIERLAPVTLSMDGPPFVRFTPTWCHDFRGLPRSASEFGRIAIPM
jgi:hypothetical protein